MDTQKFTLSNELQKQIESAKQIADGAKVIEQAKHLSNVNLHNCKEHYFNAVVAALTSAFSLELKKYLNGQQSE